MILRLLIFLKLRDKPKALQLLEKGPERAGTASRVARMASKALSMLYWYEYTHKKSVFKRMPEDEQDPYIRLMPLFSLLDGCIPYGANKDIIDEIKIKIMKYAAKKDTTINKIDQTYQAKTNIMDDVASETEAARGFWIS